KPSQFERVVQALIFVFLIQVSVIMVELCWRGIGQHDAFFNWHESFEIIWSALAAVLLGILFAWFANNDMLHGLLRIVGITKETSYPSDWYTRFSDVGFVVIHFKDNLRLLGWMKEWPSDPTKGHFLIQNPSWIKDGNEVPVEGVRHILIDVNDVRWFEFLDQPQETSHGQEST
ncbi:MAG: DUF6338 family protein, partial [Gammaproteobacteria bacterium]